MNATVLRVNSGGACRVCVGVGIPPMSLENRMSIRPLLLASLLSSALTGGMLAAPAQARPVVELSV